MGTQASRVCEYDYEANCRNVCSSANTLCDEVTSNKIVEEDCRNSHELHSSLCGDDVPIILHFDVNKTVILSDSVSMKGVEDCLRECIAELYWGELRTLNNETTWEWTGTGPSNSPPALTGTGSAVGSTCCSYRQYCKSTIKDSADRKKKTRSWALVENLPVHEEMLRLLSVALKMMQTNLGVEASKAAHAAGVAGETYNMLPSLFHLVAALQAAGRSFAVLFRSFGVDHLKVQNEWNAFCELRHPVFSSLIEDMGPWDGSDPDIPDRRIHRVHTLYRDQQGPMLILDHMTNGPQDTSWDAWAKKKPPSPEADTRQGREYVKKVLKADTVEGYSELQSWMREHLMSQSTAGIRDDWAWWHAHGEEAFAGKVLPLIGGKLKTRQIFFDDNIELDDPRIVDCRGPDGSQIPSAASLNRLCVKVNPIEALLDKDYFLHKLQNVEKGACQEPSNLSKACSPEFLNA